MSSHVPYSQKMGKSDLECPVCKQTFKASGAASHMRMMHANSGASHLDALTFCTEPGCGAKIKYGERYEHMLNAHGRKIYWVKQSQDRALGLAPKRKSTRVSKVSNPKPEVNDTTALDLIIEAERQIDVALRQLDDERNTIQKRLLELDNIAGKYRKWKEARV